MEECEVLMTYVNLIKALAKQLAIINKPLEDGDIIMILLMTLLESYNHLIMELESNNLREVIMEYIKIRLINEMTKKNKIQCEDLDFFLR